MAKQFWKYLHGCIFLIFMGTSYGSDHSTPALVNIGVLVSVNTAQGKMVKMALELAIEKVNRDPTLLRGTQLKLLVGDTNCSALQSAFAAIQLLDDGVLAILGPQSSAESYFVAQMVEAIQIPLISFSATDPSLSQPQYPYVVRVVPSEKLHMSAAADIVNYYGWQDVAALISNDDLGRNTATSLKESLDIIGSRNLYIRSFDVNTSSEEIYKVLANLKEMKHKVFVVHVQPWIGKVLLPIAFKLGMLNFGYAWIVNESVLNSLNETNIENFSASTDIVIASRPYVPLSSNWARFHSEFMKKLKDSEITQFPLSRDALYAYDALWVFTKALDRLMYEKKFLLENQTIFGDGYKERQTLGPAFLHQILSSKFLGVTGLIEFDSKGERRNNILEIVNNKGKHLETVGYWSAASRNFSVHPPFVTSTSILNGTKNVSILDNVKLFGGISKGVVDQKPHKHLNIILPKKSGFRKFVNVTFNSNNKPVYTGFCIDMFLAAIPYLPYHLSYSFTPYGNGERNPKYDEIIKKVADKEFDAAIGDIAITTERVKYVDFTLPYVDTGIVVAVPKRVTRANRIWGFLEPFTPRMWCTIGAFFILTGLVIWLLEHKKNEDFQGRRKKQLLTALWFIMSTLFSAHKENVKSALGRTVLIVWLFVVLIITSSYTANLTSILTIEQLRPSINGIAGLITSKVPIAYQSGSYVKAFMIELGIPKERLVSASSASNYTQLAHNGPARHGVGAIVDERPYIEVLLSLSCDLEISGDEVYKVGWGFAFQKGSKINEDFTHAFLKMTENGDSDKIHKRWFDNSHCKSSDDSSQFGVSTFMGLFLITGAVSTTAFIIHCILVIKSLCRDPSIMEELTRRSSFGKIGYISKQFSRRLIEEASTMPKSNDRSLSDPRSDRKLNKRRIRCSSVLFKCNKRRRPGNQ